MDKCKGLNTKEALEILERNLSSCLDRCQLRRSTWRWMMEAWWPSSPHSLFRITSTVFTMLMTLALVSSHSSNSLDMVTAAVIITLTIINLFISGWESYQRSLEVFRRAALLINKVRETRSGPDWVSSNYPHIHSPVSASIVLQLTERDGNIVNLPWSLLVTGDIVILRPGQQAPGQCRRLDSDTVLASGQVYTPGNTGNRGGDRFQLLETPYLAEMEFVLEKAADKPMSILMKQKHFLISSMLEYIFTPSVLLLVLATNCIRHMYSWSPWVSQLPMSTLFLTDPVTAILPLLPLMLPVWWVLVNTAALANVLTIFRQAQTQAQKQVQDPFDDTVETPDMEQEAVSVPLHTTWNTFCSSLMGKGEHLLRTENILHCLGTVTSFCCTDKKGILSWPNTSPEKMFFLKRVEDKDEFDDALEDEGEKIEEHSLVPEILTISNDPHNPNKVLFDDTNWQDHLCSLKPLGLSMLLNTCNIKIEESFTDFYHFLVSESQTSSPDPDQVTDLLPIPSRGCLCHLSQKIGLTETSNFQFIDQYQSFKSVSRDATNKAFNKNLSMAKLKFPFPHQVSVLFKESDSGGRMSLISQGTADVILDSCQDAWTGSDVCPLQSDSRKKIAEFYQRACLTSYCTAFAYKPIESSSNISNEYIELPTFIPTALKNNVDDDTISVGSIDDKIIDDIESNRDALTTLQSQSFLGMVQMQYQALVDMVQFIDLLEKACIRFVHFSKENELRSRVFSEKMGLESGWNCHISLANRADVEVASNMLFGSKKTSKKILKKHFLISSVPDKLNHDWRLTDLPAWGGQISQPLLGDGSLCTSAGSLNSMLEYDMNNRAQLPAGIENIRPHLDTMDNVPLLVSLFTDCTSDTTRQMMEILEENSEVVACMGSAANYQNMRVFLTAAASLAVEPLYPAVCRRVVTMAPVSSGLSPTELSQHMVALASSVSFKREEEVSVYRAIIRSRRHVLAIRRCLQLWTSCCLFLSLLVVTSCLMMLPSPLTPAQLLVITTVYIPMIITATFFSAFDNNISSMSTGKNSNILINKKKFLQSLWCYGLRFIMAFMSITFSHLLSFRNLDQQVKPRKSSCGNKICFGDIEPHLSFITDTNMTFLTLYILLTSISFVSRTDHIWRYKIKRSWHIGIVSLTIVTLQTIYYILQSWYNAEHIKSVPLWSWIILGCCLPLHLVINELVKRQEIKVNIRLQKRARLDFNTKLGMNSPF